MNKWLSFRSFKVARVGAVFLPLILTSSAAHSARSEEQVMSSHTIRFCHIAWFGDHGSKTRLGPEVELAYEFAKFLKLKPATEVVLWDDFFKDESGKVEKDQSYEPALFAKNKCDFYAANMTVNEWRQTKLDILPYHAGRIMVVVRKEDAGKIRKLDDLRGKHTIVTGDTTLEAELRKANQTLLESGKGFDIQISRTGGTDKALLSKEVDFIALDTSQALQVIQRSGNSVRISFPIGDNQSIGWGFPKKSDWLKSRFKKFIDSEKDNETSRLNQLFKSYYGVTLKGYREIIQNAQNTK